jgi:signal-transduction protein with cAMP-binding, CBS, and nucleotidyltransferase domain
MDFLFFFTKGTAVIRTKDDSADLVKLPKYSWFGDYQIFIGSRSNFTVRAAQDKDTICLVLHKDDFLEFCTELKRHYAFFFERALARRRYWNRLSVI